MRSRGIDVPQPIAAILAPTGITLSHVRTGRHACCVGLTIPANRMSGIINTSNRILGLYEGFNFRANQVYCQLYRTNYGASRPHIRVGTTSETCLTRMPDTVNALGNHA
jgi:hypothetical protein